MNHLQLERVGSSEREARAQGCASKIAEMTMTHLAQALETGGTRGS